MHFRFGVVLAAGLLLSGLAISAHAADKAGCKDPDWAPKRLQNFFIDDCDSKSWTTLDVNLTSGGKTLEGSIVRVNYSLNEGAASPASAPVLKHYVQQAQAAGAKLVSDPESITTQSLPRQHRKDRCGTSMITAAATRRAPT